jgi:phage gp45-like
VAHLSGNRSHGVVLVMGDRRFRVIGLANGDTCFHRDDGQQVHMQADGMWVSAPNGKKITGQIMTSSSMPPATQPPGASAKMGQGKQAGQTNVTKYVLDKDHVSLHHVPSGNIIWTDASGVHSTVPITVAAYPYSD